MSEVKEETKDVFDDINDIIYEEIIYGKCNYTIDRCIYSKNDMIIKIKQFAIERHNNTLYIEIQCEKQINNLLDFSYSKRKTQLIFAEELELLKKTEKKNKFHEKELNINLN